MAGLHRRTWRRLGLSGILFGIGREQRHHSRRSFELNPGAADAHCLYLLKVSPWWDPLRDEPRYYDPVRRLILPR